jgi:broad specificity phosphatase PhoE
MRRDGPIALPPEARHPGRASEARLWLVRHAEVEACWQGRAYGDLDVPLSARGLERSVVLARALSSRAPALLATSPLSRARILAERNAAECGIELRVEVGLREIHRGIWQSEERARLAERFPDAWREYHRDPWSFTGHAGETDKDIAARAWPVIESLLASARASLAPAEIVVTTHSNVIRVIAATALSIPPASSFSLRVDPGRSVLLEDALDGWRLRASNVADPGHAIHGRGPPP